MFSANENIQLRQHKKRIVAAIESRIPEDALDMGTNVMVMQVSCTDPGCVPLETAIIIVFAKSTTELVNGLAESAGGSYKTKILMPLAEVTDDDIAAALPPALGGTRTPASVATRIQEVLIAQLEQQCNSPTERTEVTRLVQQALEKYEANGCKLVQNNDDDDEGKETTDATVDNSTNDMAQVSLVASTAQQRQQTSASQQLSRQLRLSESYVLDRLAQKDRRRHDRGCPCCLSVDLDGL